MISPHENWDEIFRIDLNLLFLLVLIGRCVLARATKTSEWGLPIRIGTADITVCIEKVEIRIGVGAAAIRDSH
jgi:hypothetical protein